MQLSRSVYHVVVQGREMACQDATATAHPIYYHVDHGITIMHLQVGDRERERQYVFVSPVHVQTVHVKFTFSSLLFHPFPLGSIRSTRGNSGPWSQSIGLELNLKGLCRLLGMAKKIGIYRTHTQTLTHLVYCLVHHTLSLTVNTYTH